MTGNADSSTRPVRNAARRPAWMWYVVIAGYFLPGLIGIVVWLQLRSAGKPVMSVDWIIGMIPIFCVISAIWVLPFLSVLVAGGYLDLQQKTSVGSIYGAFLGTAIAEVVVFGEAWTNVEIVALGFLSFPRLIFLGTLTGAVAGFFGGWLMQKRAV